MAYLIGIGGGSGAGKTTLANRLQEIFKDDMIVIQYDHYCKDQSHLSMEDRKKVNFDIPESYDSELLLKHLKELKEDKPIDRPCYSFATHSREKETVKIVPNKIIVIEGIMFFPIKEVFDTLDLKIFVDASEDRRFKRRKERDVRERGRTPESVTKQFYSTVKPMHDIYVEPFKNKVDILFNNDNDNGLDETQVQKIVKTIKSNM